MTETLIDSRRIADETGTTRTLHYYLVTEEINQGNLACENYGIKVAEAHGDCTLIAGITVSQQRVDELLHLLIRNEVSPTTVGDVVADWL